jgi:hypothetical protein
MEQIFKRHVAAMSTWETLWGFFVPPICINSLKPDPGLDDSNAKRLEPLNHHLAQVRPGAWARQSSYGFARKVLNMIE